MAQNRGLSGGTHMQTVTKILEATTTLKPVQMAAGASPMTLHTQSPYFKTPMLTHPLPTHAPHPPTHPGVPSGRPRPAPRHRDQQARGGSGLLHLAVQPAAACRVPGAHADGAVPHAPPHQRLAQPGVLPGAADGRGGEAGEKRGLCECRGEGWKGCGWRRGGRGREGWGIPRTGR